MKKTLFILTVIIVLASTVVLPHIIKIKNIVCLNQNGECSQFLTRKITGLTMKDYSSTRAAIQKTLKENINVVDYSIRLKLPGTINVFVIEKDPVIEFVKGDKYVLADEQGTILGLEKLDNLPEIEIPTDITQKVGQKIPPDYQFAEDCMLDVNRIYNAKKAIIKNESLEVALENKLTVVFPLNGDREVLIGALKVVLSRLNMGKEAFRIGSAGELSPKIIDLRFKNPVIKLTDEKQ